MNNILFITAFKDIGRKNWKSHTRSNEDYYYYFLLLSKNIDYTLVVYLEDNIKREILSKYTFNDNIIFKNLSEVDTFFNKYIDEERRIINHKQFIAKVPKNRHMKHPETWCAEYTLINHSKINFVKHAKNTYPDYLFYSWIDFGYLRNIKNLPINLAIQNFPDRIIYQTFGNIPQPRVNAIEMLKIDEAKIAGSAYVIPKILIDRFEKLYDDKIKLWHQLYICDDDQSLVLQLYYENSNLFHLIIDKEWFSLYNHLSNFFLQPYLDFQDAVRYILRNNIEGCFLECGVEYGRMEKIWIEELMTSNEERDIYLFDTFSGLTEPCDNDYACTETGPINEFKTSNDLKTFWDNKQINDTTNSWCYCTLENVKKNIECLGYNNSKINYVVGNVIKTLEDENNIPDKIALLRLDTDWYESSKVELIKLYPKVSKGGIIIFDDYYYWNGQRQAVDEYFKEIGETYIFFKVNSQTAAIIKK